MQCSHLKAPLRSHPQPLPHRVRQPLITVPLSSSTHLQRGAAGTTALQSLHLPQHYRRTSAGSSHPSAESGARDLTRRINFASNATLHPASPAVVGLALAAAQTMGAMLDQDHADQQQLRHLIAPNLPPPRSSLNSLHSPGMRPGRIHDLLHPILQLQLTPLATVSSLATRLALSAHSSLTFTRAAARLCCLVFLYLTHHLLTLVLTPCLLLQPPQPLLSRFTRAASSKLLHAHIPAHVIDRLGLGAIHTPKIRRPPPRTLLQNCRVLHRIWRPRPPVSAAGRAFGPDVTELAPRGCRVGTNSRGSGAGRVRGRVRATPNGVGCGFARGVGRGFARGVGRGLGAGAGATASGRTASRPSDHRRGTQPRDTAGSAPRSPPARSASSPRRTSKSSAVERLGDDPPDLDEVLDLQAPGRQRRRPDPQPGRDRRAAAGRTGRRCG